MILGNAKMKGHDYIAEVDGYMLIVPPIWGELTKPERAAMFNGTGVDSMPPIIRRFYGKFSRQIPASKPHDVWFNFANSTLDYLEANREYWLNCKIIDRHDLGPHRWAIAPVETLRRFVCRCISFAAITIGAKVLLRRKGKGNA